jgi:hypothetical protein
MALQQVNVGSSPNDGTGDTLRASFQKVNSNNLQFSTVSLSGAYSDLIGSPSLATVATSGAYSDLTGTPTVPSAANPTATIGTTANNGTSPTYMRSDASPQFGNLTGDITSVGMTTTLSASVNLTGSPTTTTQSPSDNSTKIATTAQVQSAVAVAVAGVNPAVSVKAATTLASDTSSFTYNNGASGVGATLTGTTNTAVVIDGFTFSAMGQRLLVKNDTVSPSGSRNGVYTVTQLQTTLLPPILTRATDYDMPSDMNSTGSIPVIGGTLNALTSWLMTSTIATVGTDPLIFVQFSFSQVASANPTATASDTAVNGSALTFMRSDAAPAIQKASASVFGIAKVDGTSIVATGGVLSAAAGGGTTLFHPGYVVGNWYMRTPGTAGAGAAITATAGRFIPFIPVQSVTISALGARVAAVGSSNLQFAIYAGAVVAGQGWRPTGTALGTTGNVVNTSVATVQGALGSSVSLTGGQVYFLAVMCGDATCVCTTMVTGAGSTFWMIGDATLSNVFFSNESVTSVSTPTTFGTWPNVTSATWTEALVNTYAEVIFKVASIP